MPSLNRMKTPPPRSTNERTVVPADINPAFRLQPIGDPADAMLEEQYWRQTGVGGSAPFDGGGLEEEGSVSESEVEERNPQEPLTYHIREYESPGRKISRDVRVVKQPPPSETGEHYPAKVVPHLLLPTTGAEKGPYLEVPEWTTTRETSANGTAMDPEVHYHPVPTRNNLQPTHVQNGRESQSPVPSTSTQLVPRPAFQNGNAVISPSPSRGHAGHQPTRGISNLSRDHTTLHIRQFESRDRKISFDIKVENHKTQTKEDNTPTDIPINANNFGNSQNLDILSQPYQGQTWIAGLSQGQGQGLNPTFLGQDIVERIYPEESYTERVYEYVVDSSRTNYSLPEKHFSRNYNDYYNIDQPRGSKVDARSHQKAKRASRQTVVSKAENLLKNRRMAVLKENSSDDDLPPPVKPRIRRRGSPSKRGGHVTDSEVVLKAKLREKTMTSPEVESSPSPRVQKQTNTVPNKQTNTLKRKPNTLKRPPMVPKRQAFMKKGPVPRKSEPTQQGSEGDDDTGTTEGDGSPRKGRRGGRRFEDGSDVQNSVNPGEHRQGRRVAFFNFKEKSNPPAIESVNKQRFPYFESLLTHLTDKLQIDKGAHFIYYYDWPKLVRITSVDEFEHEGSYIVSSHALKKTNLEAIYGKYGPRQWQNGRSKHNEVQQPVQQPIQRKPPRSGHDSPGSMSGQRRRPLTVTLVSNSTGKARSCILNTNIHFEELMAGTITDLTTLDYPPATYLYAFNRGMVGKEIRSMSQLTRDHRNNDTFLVCGTEGLSPPGYYYNDMFRGRYKYPVPDHIPPTVDMSEAIRSPRSSGVSNGLPPPERRVVKIQGRRREFYKSSVYDGEEELGQPTRKLMLDWVYGYRGSDRHKNLDMLQGGELVYYVATVVVLYDSQRHRQRFYMEHNEDITCLSLHPSQKSVATGQMQGRGSDHGAHVRIWDVETLETMSVIGLGFFQNSIVSIDFSDRLNRHRVSSDFMLVVDESFRHTLSIWDIESGKRLTKTTTNTETVTGGCFYPYADDILITYGRQHLYFWTLDWDHGRSKSPKILRDKLSGYSETEDTKKINSKKKDDVPTHFTALTFTVNGDVVSGDSNGSVMLWQREGDNVFNLREESEGNSHSSAVTSLAAFDGFVMSGAGQDIFVWDIDVNGLRQPDRMEISIKGNIQALVPNPFRGEGNAIYVGTDKNCIFEGWLHQEFTPIVQGHSGESACIAVHPVEPMFVTAGSGRVMKWSAACHSCQWDVKMKGEKCSAVAIDLNDRLVAVGTKSGKVTMLDYDDWGKELHTISISSKKINSVAFAPDGIKLAVAVDEGNINICSVDKGVMERTHTTTHVHGLSMNNIDWSLDGRIIQTSSADFQVFFWNVERKPKLIPGKQLRDADFLTHKSLVSGSILGPWQHLDTGETIKSVDRTNLQHKELLVTGDSAGRLRLYKYPCASPESEFRGVRAYSGAINSAVFSGDDMFVFSSASTSNKGELKNHLGVMQWAVVDADCQVLPDHYYPDFCEHEYSHHYDPSKPHDYYYNHHRRRYHRNYHPNHPDYPRHHPHHLNHPHYHQHVPRHLRPNYYQTPYYPQNQPYYKRYQ